VKLLRNNALWQWFLLALALGLLWLTLRNIPLSEVWAQLSQLRLDQIALLVIVNLLVLATFSARWWILLYAQGYRLPYHKLMGYRLATFAVSYFTPGPHFGGEPLQVYLVTRRHGVPAPVSLAAVVLDKLIEMIFNFTFIVLGALLVLEAQTGVVQQVQVYPAAGVGLLLMLPVVILGSLGMGGHPLSRPLSVILQAWQLVTRKPAQIGDSTHSRTGQFVLTLRESEDLGCRLFRQRPGLLAAAVLVSLLSWLAIVCEFWLMTYVLGLSLSLPEAMVALLAARAAILLPLPAAVGALEASQALAMVSLGLPATYGISLSLMIRGRDVLLGLAGLGLTTVYLRDGEDERVRG
jgi:glycosyltransferase 2 family protein